MGIVYEKINEKEDSLIEEIVEDIQNGTYHLGRYDLLWSLDLTHDTITLNFVDRYSSAITTRVINRQEYETEFRSTELDADISANFDSRQLLLNGRLRSRNLHSHLHLITRKIYENVIITSW